MGEPLLVIGLVILAAHGLWLVALVATLRRSAAVARPPQPSRAQRALARQRAEQLLVAQLTEAERRQFLHCDYLEVRSPHIPERVYRIPRYRDLVEVYDSGKLALHLCIQPTRRLPEADVVLMHKLMIEGDEAEYLRIANHLPVTHWF